MKVFLNHLLTYILFLSAGLAITGCSSDEPDNPKPSEEELPKTGMSILIYAVVSDLNIESDKKEIMSGCQALDIEENKVFVYQVFKTGLPQLLELARNKDGEAEFQIVKVYDRDQYSTDPERISSVIEDFRNMSDTKSHGLIFWSHGTGWTPDKNDHGSTRTEVELPLVYSFGADLDLDNNPGYTDHTNIDELADAIPEGFFNFIWFDVCYMGGIETVYQLRNKSDYIIAMPTEDPGNGMPYDLTFPHLLKEEPDCIEAAKEFFRYYQEGLDPYWDVATIGVYFTPSIEEVADYCRNVYQGASMPSSSGLQYYSRFSHGPFYDFGQYTLRIADSIENAPDEEEFLSAMKDFVVYKAATKYNFKGQEIVQENYSGLSCHLFNPEDESEKTKYYRTLDWFKRVYSDSE